MRVTVRPMGRKSARKLAEFGAFCYLRQVSFRANKIDIRTPVLVTDIHEDDLGELFAHGFEAVEPKLPGEFSIPLLHVRCKEEETESEKETEEVG